MKNRIRFAAYTVIPILGLSLFGVGVASAHGFFGFGNSNANPDQFVSSQTTMFQNEASMLGISVDDVKNGWAQGKSLVQIAEDHGITKDQLQQKMKDAMLQQTKSRLQALVDKGVVTQSQADQRLKFLENNQNKAHRGMMMGRGFGF